MWNYDEDQTPAYFDDPPYTRTGADMLKDIGVVVGLVLGFLLAYWVLMVPHGGPITCEVLTSTQMLCEQDGDHWVEDRP